MLASIFVNLLVIASFLIISINGFSNPYGVYPAKAEVTPILPQLVNNQVQIKCQGILGHGGIIFKSPVEHPTPAQEVNVLQWHYEEVHHSNGTNTVEPLVRALNDHSLGTRVTPSLNPDHLALLFTFLVRYSDNGWYGCKYFNEGKTSIQETTNTVLVSSYYPTTVRSIHFQEEKMIKLKQKTINKVKMTVPVTRFVMRVKCQASSGYPVSCARMQFSDGEVIPNVQISRRPHIISAVDHTYTAYDYTLRAQVRAAFENDGRSIECKVGVPCPSQKQSKNPDHKSISTRLRVQIPVSKPEITNGTFVFRHGGRKLSCGAKGLPRPAFSWQMSGQSHTSTGSEFTVPNKPGIYTVKCFAKNIVLGQEYEEHKPFQFAVVPPTCQLHPDSLTVH